MRALLLCECGACRDIARARRRRESAVVLTLLLVGSVCLWGAVVMRSACEWGAR